jgi:hypothetical protein
MFGKHFQNNKTSELTLLGDRLPIASLFALPKALFSIKYKATFFISEWFANKESRIGSQKL